MALSQLLVISWMSAIAFGTTFDDCPTGLNRDKYLKVYKDNCYRFEINVKKDYDDAQKQCQQDGGNLALVKTTLINAFVQKTLKQTYQVYSDPIWIGLRHSYATKGLQWLDGTSVTYKHFSTKDSYAPNECVAMLPITGRWLGYKCQAKVSSFVRKNNFVCQYAVLQPNATTPPTTTRTPSTLDDCPLSLVRDRYLNIYGDKCYKFEFYTQHNFDQAQAYCQEDGGNLASIESKTVNDYMHWQVRNHYRRDMKPIWIGLRYDTDDQMFKWLDDENVTYSNFRSKEDTDGDECVAFMPYDSKWKTLKCDSTGTLKPFVCEYPAFRLPSTNQPRMMKKNCPVISSTGSDFHIFENKCYYFNLNDSLTFQNAEMFCQQYGGSLATIKSKNVENFLQHEMHKTHELSFQSPSIWIGLSYDQKLKRYSWADNSPIGYNKFEYDTPAGECVAMIPWNGEWEGLNCNSKDPDQNPRKHFICEFTNSSTTSTIDTTPSTTFANISMESSTTTTSTTTEYPTTITTSPTPEITTPCSTVSCSLDCGFAGYAMDADTGCILCECLDYD